MRDDADGPDVHSFVVGLLSDYLWSHVEGRAEHLAQARLGTVVDREAEICQLQVQLVRVVVFLRSKQDILRLDVPVGNVLLVHVI